MSSTTHIFAFEDSRSLYIRRLRYASNIFSHGNRKDFIEVHTNWQLFSSKRVTSSPKWRAVTPNNNEFHMRFYLTWYNLNSGLYVCIKHNYAFSFICTNKGIVTFCYVLYEGYMSVLRIAYKFIWKILKGNIVWRFIIPIYIQLLNHCISIWLLLIPFANALKTVALYFMISYTS